MSAQGQPDGVHGGPRSLAEMMVDGPLPPREAARIGRGVLAGLAAGHRSGLVHGDVRPANVMLDRDGRAVLVAGAEATDRSPEYLAPERAAGGRPGPESDLWALGAVLYTAVEGRPPFEDGRAAGDQPLPDASHAGPLEPVIEGLLRADPAARPSADWTRHMLNRVAAGFTIGPATAEASPPRGAAVPSPLETQPPVEQPVARQSSGGKIASAVLALALIGAGVGYLVASGSSSPKTPTSRIPAMAQAPTAPSTPAPSTPSTPAPTPTPTPTPSTPSAPQLGAPPATSPQPSPATPSPPPATSPQPPPATSPQPPASPPPPSTPSQPSVPPGFTQTTDPAGFSFAAPDGWTRSQNGTGQVDYSPDGGNHLLAFFVTPTVTQSSADHFLQLEQTAAAAQNYTRLTLVANTFRGDSGALWEYTYTDSQGVAQHVIDQAFVTPGGTEYAIAVSSPEADWSSAQQVFTTVLNTFTIP